MKHSSQNTLIAYSSENRGDIASALGNAHYSYVFVENALINLINKLNYKTKHIKKPQNVFTDIAFQDIVGSDKKNVIHISIRSTENIRLLKGAKNIAVFFWEFPVMRDHGLLTEMIVYNQKHMLSLVDEIWVGCKFSKDVLNSYGLKNVFVIPPPIFGEHPPSKHQKELVESELSQINFQPLCYYGAISGNLNSQLMMNLLQSRKSNLGWDQAGFFRDKLVFLAILNPNDLRKNLLNLIEGFLIGSDSNRSVLIIKLITNQKSSLDGEALYKSLVNLLTKNYSCMADNILIVTDYLSSFHMECLYSLADYYLCASHCEGLNMPLLESMSYGVVPITTHNTAMLDYIMDQNAIIIESSIQTSPIEGMAGDISGYPFELSVSTRFHIAKAINKAQKIERKDYVSLSSKAKDSIINYGEQKVSDLVKTRLTALLEER